MSEPARVLVTLELFASAAGIQPSTAAPEAGLMEQEQTLSVSRHVAANAYVCPGRRFSTVDVGR